MSEDHKKQLEQQLWNIANTLRGKMNADEFRDYILGFIFYKYLSERMHLYANTLLKQDGITYRQIDEDSAEGQAYLEAIKEESILQLGYFLKPSELFHAIAERGKGNGKSAFILNDLTRILSNIEQSTLGTESEDDFDKLFEDLDLTSTKLGRTESAKNELIAKVLAHLDKIDFHLEETNIDVLGRRLRVPDRQVRQRRRQEGRRVPERSTIPQGVALGLVMLPFQGRPLIRTQVYGDQENSLTDLFSTSSPAEGLLTRKLFRRPTL